MATAGPKRRDDFYAGREMGRRALALLGVPPADLPRQKSGTVQWPPGCIGSISHTAQLVIAAAGMSKTVRGIGIDAEDVAAVEPELAPEILTPTERLRMSKLDHENQRMELALTFSAKEALFKAQFPNAQLWLDFSDVQVEFDNGIFQAVCGKLSDTCFATERFVGRYVVVEGHVITAVVLP